MVRTKASGSVDLRPDFEKKEKGREFASPLHQHHAFAASMAVMLVVLAALLCGWAPWTALVSASECVFCTEKETFDLSSVPTTTFQLNDSYYATSPCAAVNP